MPGIFKIPQRPKVSEVGSYIRMEKSGIFSAQVRQHKYITYFQDHQNEISQAEAKTYKGRNVTEIRDEHKRVPKNRPQPKPVGGLGMAMLEVRSTS